MSSTELNAYKRKKINLVCKNPENVLNKIEKDRLIIVLCNNSEKKIIVDILMKMDNELMLFCDKIIKDEVMSLINDLIKSERKITIVCYYSTVPVGLDKLKMLNTDNKDVNILNFVNINTFIRLQNEEQIKKYSYIYFDLDPNFCPKRINKNVWNLAWTVYKKDIVIIGDNIYYKDNDDLFSVYDKIKEIIGYPLNNNISVDKLNSNVFLIGDNVEMILGYLENKNINFKTIMINDLIEKNNKQTIVGRIDNDEVFNKLIDMMSTNSRIIFYYFRFKLNNKYFVLDEKYNIVGILEIENNYLFNFKNIEIFDGVFKSPTNVILSYGIDMNYYDKLFEKSIKINVNKSGYKKLLIEFMEGKNADRRTLMLYNIRRMNNELDLLIEMANKINTTVIFLFSKMVCCLDEYDKYVDYVLFNIKTIDNMLLFAKKYNFTKLDNKAFIRGLNQFDNYLLFGQKNEKFDTLMKLSEN